MKTFLIATCFATLFAFNSSAKDFRIEVEKSLSLLKSDKEQCIVFTKALLKDATEANDHFAIVKSNYILGYIEKLRGDYGKAVIYYLEGIRYAETSTYDEASKDLVNLLQNTGNIFKKFNNYNLARKYYSEAMEIASINEDFQKYTYLILLNAKVLKEESNFEEAASLLESTFSNFNQINKKTIADIYNQLGLIYTDQGNEQLALENFNKLINLAKADTSSLKLYISRAYQNIGNFYFVHDRFQEAIKHFKIAINFKIKNNASDKSKFISYKDLSESLINIGEYDSAAHYLSFAEKFYDSSIDVTKSYEIFKFKSLIARETGDLNSYASNQGMYSDILEKYHEEQRNTEATDKKYNLDLITQRYFALVAQEERNQQIQYYSAVGGSFLVSLIVLIIAFFQYRKYRLRKDLEASLKPYIKNTL